MRLLPLAALAASLLLTPWLQAEQHLYLLGDDPAYLAHSAPGYLGVGTRDIDNDRASKLKLKSARGVEIVTMDHDAPAAKAGLRVHDVILRMNDQPIEGQAQLGRLLRETPPGRTVSFLISRDGQEQSLNVTLCDRSTLEADAWSQHIPVEPDDDDPISLPNSSSGVGSSFLSALGMNSGYTGLELDMLGPQLADYFGIHDGQGLLVKRVDDNSPGSVAGLRAGDVITRVNGKTMATTSQWMRAIHANRGKPVQLTVIRDHKENVVTMTAGHGKNKGSVTWPAGMAPELMFRSMATGIKQFGNVAANEIGALPGQLAAVYRHDLP
ncbi:MAG TPA: PDZ domain-containing protein [Acidobacteriaceae bacterium]|nr:PDZ domain-containing protein [Acidobacteriaceae bacterium]